MAKDPTWVLPGIRALLIYYPGHAILIFWNAEGEKNLFGYQLKKEKSIPQVFAYNNLFAWSFYPWCSYRKD